MKNSFIFIFCSIISIDHSFVSAQTIAENSSPEVDQLMPDFELKNIQYGKQKNLSREDLKGKWYILDFFATGCTTCFASFPKTNKLQQEFKDQAQIFLVGLEDKYIRSIYEKFRKRQNLELPVVFDSVLSKRWDIRGYPHVVWVNDEGIVKAVTGSNELKRENIEAFIEGEDFDFRDVGKAAIIRRASSSDLKNTDEGKSILFNSLLSSWNKDEQFQRIPGSISSNIQGKGRFECTGATAWMLYQYAFYGTATESEYYGNSFHLPIMELQDPALFQFDFGTGRNIFNYRLIVPPEKSTHQFMMELMQRDLKDYFGYNVALEERKVPYWRLIATDKAKKKLKTKGNTQEISGSHAGYHFINITIRDLIFAIWRYHQQEPPFIDETEINFNIDIKVDALMTDLEDIRRVLRSQGLDLIKSEKVMPAIVIRDK